MEEKNKSKENNSKFKTISSNGKAYNGYSKNHSDFGKSVLIPFVSGIVGCSVVIGTCFGVPSIKSKLIGTTTLSTTNSTSTNSDGYVKENSLEQYSDTSVYAANKILPSIVGINIEYSNPTNNNDAVKIMNIHKSKGLEFSLCYYTGIDNTFNIKEIKTNFLYSNKYGIIYPYIDFNSDECTNN